MLKVMKYFSKIIALICVSLVFLCGCTRENDRETLNNDTITANVPGHVQKGNSQQKGTIIIKVEESFAQKIESGASTLPEGVRLRKAFSGDPAFEERHRKAGLHLWYYAEAEEGVPATKARHELEEMEGLEYMETIPEAEVNSYIPFDDPSSGLQWHLNNNGAIVSGAVAGRDINVIPVWENFTAGSKEVIVGVVDSGIQYDHPDLQGVVIPPGPSGSKSFLNSESSHPYAYTPQRHGTHVAGIIAAINNNGTGGCGIAGGNDGTGGVKILDCQAIANLEGDSGDIYSAIVWAADHGAVLLNNSWNLSYDSMDLVPDTTPFYYRTVIDYFINNAGTDKNGHQTGPMKGGVVFFSAGNKEWTRSQPSMYENVIAVGATGPAGESSAYTNYGDWVDICAPGGNYSPYGNYNAIIYSSVSGSGYAQMQGTSQACPMATGVAALLVSHFGGEGFTNKDLKELLLGGADREYTHTREIGPTLDAHESFLIKNRKMDPVEDLKAEFSNLSATLRWTNGHCGDWRFYGYKTIVSEDESFLKDCDPFNLPSGVRSRTTLVKSAPGASMSAAFHQLDSCRTYYAVSYGYTRSHQYTKDSKVIKFRINGAPSIKRSGNPDAIELKYKDDKDVELLYSDPDSDELAVTVEPGSPACTWTDDGKGRLTMHFDGSKAPSGRYTARATVSDSQKKSSLDIPYTLIGNSPVQLVSPIEGTILQAGGNGVFLRLPDHFTDPDGDTIEYEVSCDNPSVYLNNFHGLLQISGEKFTIAEVSVSASDGIGAPASCRFSIRIQDDESGVCFSPSTVTDKLSVSCSSEGQAMISIYSSTGRNVFSKSVEQGPFSPYELDVTGLAPGVYTVKVSSGKENRKFRIVKI